MSAYRTAPETLRPRLAGTLGIAIGAVSIVVGALVLLLPRTTLLVLAVLLGLQLVVLGAVRILLARSLTRPGGARGLWVGLGALTVVAGIFCVIRPGASLVVVAVLLAAGWIADGIGEIVMGVRSEGDTGPRLLAGLWGVTMIVAGLVVAVFPGESLALLVQIAGVALIILGAVQLVAGIGRRRAITA